MLMRNYLRKEYLAPEFEIQVVVAERGYIGSMLEDPIERPDQNW